MPAKSSKKSTRSNSSASKKGGASKARPKIKKKASAPKRKKVTKGASKKTSKRAAAKTARSSSKPRQSKSAPATTQRAFAAPRKEAPVEIPTLAHEDSTASEILKRLREALSPISVSLLNLTHQHKGHAEAKRSGGGHYRLSITSEAFGGLGLRERQQWVMNLLRDLFGKGLHALQMNLLEPSEVPLREEVKGSLMRGAKRSSEKPRS